MDYKHTSHGCGALRLSLLATAIAAVLMPTVQAVEVDTGSEEWSVRFDNTGKFNYGVRTESADERMLATPNNNDGDYKPSKCEWQDATTQARNKRNTRLFEYNGSLKTLAAHCESVGLPQSAIKGRVYMQGMTMTEAISKSISQPA